MAVAHLSEARDGTGFLAGSPRPLNGRPPELASLRLDRQVGRNSSLRARQQRRGGFETLGSARPGGQPGELHTAIQTEIDRRVTRLMFQQVKAFSGFAVDDVAKAKEFYGQTLGLRVSEQ